MAGGFAAAFLDNAARVAPRHTLDLLSSLSPASLQSLASNAASEMTESLLYSTLSQKADDHAPPEDNEAFAAMCVLVATCARDAGARTPAERRQQLYALGVEDEDLQTKLLPVLAAVVPSVELVLENTSFDFAHVVDVSWRLDYVLRSSSAGSIHTPLYFVELKLQSPSAANSGLQTVSFSCTVEQLRSLVYRIQEAVNEVEKLAAGTPSQL